MEQGNARPLSTYFRVRGDLEALDHDLQEGATQAEVQRVGAGLKYILQELIERSVLSGFEI